jgi:hypothetical protein
MTNLIIDLRGLAEAGMSEYTIVTSGNPQTYFSDQHLQDVLDANRRDVIFEPAQMYPTQISGGSLSYQDYRSMYSNYEATTGGSVIFYIQDSTGAFKGTADYTPLWRGQFQFELIRGSVYYITGRLLPNAVGLVWDKRRLTILLHLLISAQTITVFQGHRFILTVSKWPHTLKV